MKNIPILRHVRHAVAGLFLLSLAGWPLVAPAQSQTETKIRLMADALRARDGGDLITARDNLRQLLELAPNDVTVQRLLASVENQLAGRAAPIIAAPVSPVSEDVEIPEVTYSPTPVTPRTEPSYSEPVTYAAPTAPAPVAEPAAEDYDFGDEAEALAREETNRLNALVETAKADIKEARSLAKSDNYDAAITLVDTTARGLPNNSMMTGVLNDLAKEKGELILAKAQFQLKRGDVEAAKATLDQYAQEGLSSRSADRVANRIAKAEFNPPLPPLSETSAEFLDDQREIAKLTAKGRAQYLGGDYDGAQETFRLAESLDPDNPEPKNFLLRIASEKAQLGALNREKTRAQLLEEVAKAWQRPGIYEERSGNTAENARVTTQLAQKLEQIQIPSVSFSAVDLKRVVSTLSDLSAEYDTTGAGNRGVNIVVIDPQNGNPGISITLRNLSLKRILDVVTDSVGYQYEVQSDLIVVRPGGETTTLDTAFFPVTRSTVIRMTGLGGSSSTAAVSNDPFAPAPAPAATGGGGGESGALRAFLQQAGVNFESVPGSSLAYDGSAMIVTQTTRNIERIRNILNRYNDVRQVEIEAKFMEVQEGALEELGVKWNVSRRGVAQFDPSTGAPVLGPDGRQVFSPQEVYTTGGVNRTLSDAFSSTTGSSVLSIERAAGTTVTAGGVASTTTGISQRVPFAAPTLPNAVPLGSLAGSLASITGMVGEFDVNAVIRALSQQAGSDLLSAPKITVLSGNPANIVVAQELRYPQSYGEIQSEVGSSGSSVNGGGSAGVTITAGTPQEFTTRNVGVELKVTPTVEEDDYSISLDLAPKVTEFEGFVEYGGTSVAISGGTTVTVPSGFYQPIFSVRELTTKVTIWDGATLVMGGLTREEVKKVNDKVPILGDIPLLGRAFRSKGESSQKRNLLIFVTANLVSPGGSPKKQALKSVAPSSMFQNPTIVTPASSESRVRGN